MNEDKYLRIKQVTSRTGLSRATIYHMMDAGTFPMKTSLGVRAVGWLESELTTWMAGRQAIEKTGREAKPGRSPSPGTKRRPAIPTASSDTAAISVDSGQAAARRGSSKAGAVGDEWGHDDPPPSDESMEAIHTRLRMLNSSQNLKGSALKDSSARQGQYRSVDVRPENVEKKKNN